MKVAILIISFVLSTGSLFCQKCTSCKNLNIIDAVKNDILSEDLAILDVNAKILACPKFIHGDSALCNPVPKITEDRWNRNLPNNLFWTLFFFKESL